MRSTEDIEQLVDRVLGNMPAEAREQIKRKVLENEQAVNSYASDIRQLLNEEHGLPPGQRPAFDAALQVGDYLWSQTGRRDYTQMAAVGVVLLSSVLIANSAEHDGDSDPPLPSLEQLNNLAVASFDVVQEQWEVALTRNAVNAMKHAAAAAEGAAHQGEAQLNTHKGMTYEDVVAMARKSRLAGDPAAPAQRIASQGPGHDYVRPFPNMSRAVNTDDRH